MSQQQSEQKGLLMNIEANKAIVRKCTELWSTGNLALADEVLAANFVDHRHPNQAPGPESVNQEDKAFRGGAVEYSRHLELGSATLWLFFLRCIQTIE